jgi:hypothetical protein
VSAERARTVREIFDEGEVREVLGSTFYKTEARPKRPGQKKPDHYEIICISLYTEDLARLDDKVAQLKARGHRRMTRSALIRWALDQVDVEKVPKGP